MKKKNLEISQEKTSVDTSEKKGKNNKVKIIVICAVLLLVGAFGYFGYQYYELKKPIEEDWGEKYYVYLKDVNEKKNGDKAGLPKDLKKSDLSFYEVENVNDPVMVINYEKEKQNYSNVYYILDGKVNVIVYNQPSEIELLYNIESKKYDYYSHITEDKTNKYKTIAEQINETIKQFEKNKKSDEQVLEEATEYVFSDETVDKVVDVNGKEIVLNKFDETFVKPNVKSKTINYSTSLDERDLKLAVTKQIDEYKPTKEVVTKETQTEVDKKVEEVEKVKQEMATAKEEVEKREAEEKARKEAEEREKAEREGFKVGSYTLKYGRYEWDLAEVGDPGRKETYILRSDKTCTHTDYEGKTTSCTFTTGRATDGQSIESMVERDAIIIHENGGYSRSYFPKTGGFRDTDLENFLYKGAN